MAHRNLHQALPNELRELVFYGDLTPSRAGGTMERLHHTIDLYRPWERFQFHTLRGDSPFAKIAESIWVLAGRGDVDWLSYYLPRAKDFSDDGNVWRAAYGPRLRRWPGVYNGMTVDQLMQVYTRLRADPTDRRAVASLWDPARDTTGTLSKDFPCNDWLHFLIRHNKLHLAVAVRSNDAWWGWSGINSFEWSLIQEVMAFWLGTEMGTLSTYASSFHLYERHWTRATRLFRDLPLDPSAGDPYAVTEGDRILTRVHWSTSYDKTYPELDAFFKVEQAMRRHSRDDSPFDSINVDLISDPWLHAAAETLWIYIRLQDGASEEELGQYFAAMNAAGSDFALASILYVQRHFAALAGVTVNG